MAKKLFLVDGSNHAFRAQFALPPQHTSTGFPTRVLYGFTLLFQKMMRTYRPDYCVVSFDSGKTFRHELFPAYKGHRPDMPEDMVPQWPRLPELVESFGYRCLHVEGFEADDVLGTLAHRFAGADLDVYIVSSDKDFAQLFSDHVSLLDEGKGGKVFGTHDIAAKFRLGDDLALTPAQVLDLLALAGDSSDNIPGVPGVGPKTAAKLLVEHADLDGVLAAALRGEIKGKRGQALIDHAEDARLSKTLATIRTDVPIDVALADLAPQGLQSDAMKRLFHEWEFTEVARKLLPETDAIDRKSLRVIADTDDLLATLSNARKAPVVGVSLRQSEGPSGQGTWLGAALSVDGDTAYIPLVERADLRLDVPTAKDALLDLLCDASVAKVGYDTKCLHSAVAATGRAAAGFVGDVLLLDYLLAAHRRGRSLSDLAKRHLAHSLMADPLSEPMLIADFAPCAEPALVARHLHERLDGRLSEELRSLYADVELPLAAVLADMERNGIRLDLDVMATIEQDISERLVEAEHACHRIHGSAFKVGSPKEVSRILFGPVEASDEDSVDDRQRARRNHSKKTKTGFSTDAGVLERLATEWPEDELPAAILAWRALQKLESTYVKALPKAVADDGRIHTTFNQAVAATGRLSSQDPNLQNIPIRTFEGRRLRDGFVAAPGHLLVSADYSQVELRILAHVSAEPALVESFRNGADIHRRTASEVWEIPFDEVTAERRAAAKAINFGLLYGMSAFRLARDLGVSRSEAQAYIDRYFGRMPGVLDWIETTKQAARETGAVQTLFGRRRLVPEIQSKDFNERAVGEREAVNTVIQGTAADIIKIAMLDVHRALHQQLPTCRLLLQVHDELLVEAPEDRVHDAETLLVERMTNAVALDVPLDVQCGKGWNWNDAHA